jgi:Na+-driven multidrug efflux pump
MVLYFEKKYRYLRFRVAQMRPQLKIWNGMLRIGVPAGTEFILLFVYIVVVYGIIRGFGPAAQAGFSVGARVMQALFLPVVALAFAVSPVVGQNFGGRRADRVRQSVYSAIIIASLMMLVLALLAHFVPRPMIRAFSNDPHVIEFGSDYLRIAALNFVAAGIVFTTSSIFQGIGNTLPPLFSSVTRLFLFVLPALLLARTPGFEIKHVWYLSVASQLIQACINLLLLRHEMRKKLNFTGLDDLAPGGATAT